MAEGYRYRCEVTSGLLDEAERQLAWVLWSRNEAAYRAALARRRLPVQALRRVGLVLTAVGVALSGLGVVLGPELDAHATPAPVFLALLVGFALAGLLLARERSVTDALRRFTRRVVAWRARQLFAPPRRSVPYAVEYLISATSLEARREGPAQAQVTDLRRVRSAVVSASIACLFSRPTGGGLARVVHCGEPGARLAVVEALRAASVEVVEVGAPPSP
jgi:hypothetical protein